MFYCAKNITVVFSGTSITNFSQKDLSLGKISYKHTSKSLQTEDQIVFDVSDGSNSVSIIHLINLLSI